MAKGPEDRYPSMAELEAALVPQVTVPGTAAPDTTTAPRPDAVTRLRSFYQERRHRLTPLLIAAAAFFVVIGLTGRHEDPQAGADEVIGDPTALASATPDTLEEPPTEDEPSSPPPSTPPTEEPLAPSNDPPADDRTLASTKTAEEALDEPPTPDDVDPSEEGVTVIAVASPPPEPELEPKPKPKPKPNTGPTNRSLRRTLASKIKSCGKNGRVEVRATYVLSTGRLFQPEVKVLGAAAEDPSVRGCVQQQLATFKLLPRKEPSGFRTMAVPI